MKGKPEPEHDGAAKHGTHMQEEHDRRSFAPLSVLHCPGTEDRFKAKAPWHETVREVMDKRVAHTCAFGRSRVNVRAKGERKIQMDLKTTVLVDTLRFPECPRWHEGTLWCSDFFARRVIQVDLHGGEKTVVSLPDMPCGLGWTPQGRLLVVAAFARRLLRLEDDGLVEVADLSSLVTYPNNDMVVDRQGRAYIGNMGYVFGQGTPQPGPILLVTPQGSARVVAEGLAFPNGMVITPDGQTLIVAESHAARLTAFHIVSRFRGSPWPAC